MLCEEASSGRRKRGKDPGLCSIIEVLILFVCSTFHNNLSFFFPFRLEMLVVGK